MSKQNCRFSLSAALIFCAAVYFSINTIVFAEEAAAYKERSRSVYSDFFEQNFYNEGVRQLDLSRWFRTFTGKQIPSQNVNIYGEVPDSGFWTNRHARKKLSANELAAGRKETSGPDLEKSLTVTHIEQRGLHPQIWITDARGDKYILEFDSVLYPELTTGAQIIASRFYHAIGYFVPQLTLISFSSDILQISPDAVELKDTGFETPLTQERLEEYLVLLPQTFAGEYRASARLLPNGKTYGAFSFTTRRKEDAKDIVNHRDLREIRALAIFASWLNHFDIRESGTLDVETKNGLEHCLTDFSGVLGATAADPKEPMLGYENAMDFSETGKAMVKFGLGEKTWQKKWRVNSGKLSPDFALGYFSNDFFDPAKFKTEFPYEAFRMITKEDGAWAAKILKSFSDDDIRAIVETAEYSNPETTTAIVKILSERRDIIADFWTKEEYGK